MSPSAFKFSDASQLKDTATSIKRQGDTLRASNEEESHALYIKSGVLFALSIFKTEVTKREENKAPLLLFSSSFFF
jgi:hypothetical protein